jgi:hypothetical protein
VRRTKTKRETRRVADGATTRRRRRRREETKREKPKARTRTTTTPGRTEASAPRW